MYIKSSIIIFISVFIPNCYAQQIRSLQDCIDYAIANSIQIKRQNNAIKIAKQELNTAKNSILPSIIGHSSQDFSFGRGISAENTYTSTDVRTTTFAIAAEFPIFTGFRISNTVRQKQHLYNASILDLQKTEDALCIDIIRAFQDVLYKKEERIIYYRQFLVDSIQTERIKILVQKGKASKVELVSQISAQTRSKIKYIQANNSLKMSLLTLSQLMELPSPDSLYLSEYYIPIDKIHIDEPETVFESAVTFKADVKAEKQRLYAYERQIKISKSKLYPTLSFTGGIGAKYYVTSSLFNESFGKQLKNNLCKYVMFNLTIPLFNRFETRNSIAKTKIERNNQYLILEESKKSLYKAIQQAHYAALDAQSRYLVCNESSASAKENLKLVLAKYENGLADITDYNEAKNASSEADSKLIQAKFEFIFAVEILKFYKRNKKTIYNEQ